jgi:hypothetical protein
MQARMQQSTIIPAPKFRREGASLGGITAEVAKNQGWLRI